MSGLHMRRRTDSEECPMTPDQVTTMLENQKKLMADMADIKKYLFAGRVVVGTFVLVGLSLDWTRDHLSFIKAWLDGK